MRFRNVGGLLLAPAIAGCMATTREPNETVFTYSIWTPIGVLIAGLLALLIGLALLLLRSRYRRLGIVLVIMGAFADTLVAPAMLMDRVILSPKGFSVRTGFWWSPTRYEVDFARLSRIEVVVRPQVGRKGATAYDLLCVDRDGRESRHPITDLMRQGALEKIFQMAREKGVEVINHPDLR